MKKVAILYVCTGKYIQFWNEFFESAERHFMTQAERHYFVFTDQQFAQQNLPQVTRIEQANLGWPDNTLKRYHMFLGIEQQLAEFDYLYFFNANCVFRQDVGTEFLPQQGGLMVVRHPGQVDKHPDKTPYERNLRSRACIPTGQGKHYVCGGVNGGTAKAFLQLARTVRQAVDQDIRDGVVAQWHDESHLNRYILDHDHSVQHAGYCYPEDWKLAQPKIIEVRNKNKTALGSVDKLRALGTSNQAENMVTVKVFGGLGNQMFQYALGRALAIRNGCRLQLDLRHYDKNRAFRYGLGDFNIEAVIGTSRTLPPAKSTTLQYLRWRYLPKQHRMIRERSFGFHPQVLKSTGSIYLQGYWQTGKYFSEIADTIRDEFEFVDPPNDQNAEMLDRIRSGPSIALHVRRGDYVSNPKARKFHGTCPPDYYHRAVQQIVQKLRSDHTVYVVSDDWQWAQRNLRIDCPMVFVHHNDSFSAHEDLRLMTACQHQVISNSTFSWWSAWLNRYPQKQVIAPQQWFADPKVQNNDLIPPDWQRLDACLVAEPQLRAA